MNLIKLVHPKYGVISERQTNHGTNSYKIINSWKLKYGAKFSECITDVENIGNSKSFLRTYKTNKS